MTSTRSTPDDSIDVGAAMRIAGLVVRLVLMLAAIGMMVAAALPSTPTGWMNRGLLALVGVSLLFASLPALVTSWRRRKTIRSVERVTLDPGRLALRGAFRATLRGTGPAEIDVAIDTAPFKITEETVVLAIKLVHEDDVQSGECGFRPVPKEQKLKSFQLSARHPEPYDEPAWTFDIGAEGEWSASIEIDFAPDSDAAEPIDVTVTTWGARQEVTLETLTE